MIVDTIAGPFNKSRYISLKKSYENAVNNNREEFTFEEQPLLTNFTKYLLEYLSSIFKEDSNE